MAKPDLRLAVLLRRYREIQLELQLGQLEYAAGQKLFVQAMVNRAADKIDGARAELAVLTRILAKPKDLVVTEANDPSVTLRDYARERTFPVKPEVAALVQALYALDGGWTSYRRLQQDSPLLAGVTNFGRDLVNRKGLIPPPIRALLEIKPGGGVRLDVSRIDLRRPDEF